MNTIIQSSHVKPARPTPTFRKDAPACVRGVTLAAVVACLAGMAAFVWVADRLWGSVGIGVLLVLALTAAFALPELMLIAFVQLQQANVDDHGSAGAD